MAQINIKGKEDEIQFIKQSYSKLGIKISPRLQDLAISDIKVLSGITTNYDMDINTIDYDMNMFERKILREINFFEYTLKKLKNKMFSSNISHEHYPEFIRILEDITRKLEDNKSKLRNYDALYKECLQIKELINYFKTEDTVKAINWYSTYKKSDIIYEYMKLQGLSNTDIYEVQQLIQSKIYKNTNKTFKAKNENLYEM